MEIIPYRISKIKTLQFAIFPDKYVNGKEVGIEVKFNFSHNRELDSIRCIALFKYIQTELLLISETECIFDIAPEGVEKLKKEGEIPVQFLRYMGTIVTGTVRGIIHSKTEGTVINSIVLPPINLVNTIKKPMRISVDNE